MADKVLVVGDYRDCLNYGAIATTESLLDMIYEKVEKDNVRTIGYRSFLEKTPPAGWDIDTDKFLDVSIKRRESKKVKKAIKRSLYKIGLLDKIINTVAKEEKDSSNLYNYFHIPVKYKYYEKFTKEVFDGKKLQYEYKLLEWSDVVLINAEGSIVKGTDKNGVYRVGGLYCLYMAYLAKKMEKKCYIVNHTVDPKNRDIYEMIDKVYPLLDGIYLREPKSIDVLKKSINKNIVYAPDALFNFEENEKCKMPQIEGIDFSKPFICLGDSSGIYASGIRIKWDIVKTYGKIIHELKKECDQILFVDGFSGRNEDIKEIIRKNNLPSVSLVNTSYYELFEILKKAEIFVSGRWHSSILSVVAGTPILLFGSDSHKTEALYEMLDYKYKFFDIETLPINSKEIAGEVKKILNNKNSLDNNKVLELKNLSLKNNEML